MAHHRSKPRASVEASQGNPGRSLSGIFLFTSRQAVGMFWIPSCTNGKSQRFSMVISIFTAGMAVMINIKIGIIAHASSAVVLCAKLAEMLSGDWRKLAME